ARRVRSMFDAIAPTYELVNRLASVGLDAGWRRSMVRLAGIRPDDRQLDVACGTGDVCRTFAAARPAPARIVGGDFAGRMLEEARTRNNDRIVWCQADALALPFADQSFTLVTCAFGVRNFQSLETGLREMWRVLQPGGRAIILEFGLPSTPMMRRLYHLYFTRMMPWAATLLSRDRSGAYRYLPRSVLSFHDQAGLASHLRQAGFGEVAMFPLTRGIVSVFRAHR
ncbi:MAG: ubiquinone/menaquinone biosynthesis methyltransferase, partial [Phycisphaerae bacterium]|nr:ubiquinone/menaquinone biosynthesis methyltransferase [Phycisphaerae bacterium]